MSSEKATGIVIRVVDFSESSLIVTIFTREFGKIGGLAKGARRLKGPFESALDLLALCRIVFLRKTSDALDLLTEAKLLRRFRTPGNNLLSLYSGYYVAELLNEMTDRGDPQPELFEIADETLAALAVGESPLRRVIRFELAMLRELGHMPSLDTCAACGAPAEPRPRTAFGMLDGGVLCERCRQGKRQVVSISGGALKTMAAFASEDAELWRRTEVEPRLLGELRGVMNRYLCNLLGYKPRMHNSLGALWSADLRSGSAINE